MDPNGVFIYILARNVLYKLDNNLNLIATISSFNQPRDLAITSDGKYVYVTEQADHTVSVVDTTTDQIISSVEGPWRYPQSIALGPDFLPPTNLSGVQKKNDFGLSYEWYNLLSWSPSSSVGVKGYCIYRDGVKIATVGPKTFNYEDHNRKKGVPILYQVSSLSSSGIESNFVTVTVK